MRLNYKRLGSYIIEIDYRNLEDKRDHLLGVSTKKIFIESIANTVGKDFKTYKIIKRNQFAYVPDTSRRGDKIGIALLEHLDEGLISQAYTVFEITETEKLLPEYLMMWFRRPEFDRYSRFHSWGSVREIFDWESLCNVELPIPHPDKQKEIVKEYNTIINRIKLNEQLIQKLEETTQAIYKQWFIDFEFPDENGNPYKSSGGEMIYNKKLDKEIPISFNSSTLGTFILSSSGGDWGKDDPKGNYKKKVRCIRGTDIPSVRICQKDRLPTRYLLPINEENKRLTAGDIVVEISGGSPTQSTGRTVLISQELIDYVQDSLICSNFCRFIKPVQGYYAFLYGVLNQMYKSGLFFRYENSSNGVMNLALDDIFKEEYVAVSNPVCINLYSEQVNEVERSKLKIGKELECLEKLKSILLSKLATIEQRV